MHRKLFTVTMMFLALASFAFANTYVVTEDGSANNPDGSAGYSSIQIAIDAAVNDDVIIVGAGTYTENINFNGKAITLRSGDVTDPSNTATDAANTIIDGGAAGSVVTFNNGESYNSVLAGFTITNGFSLYGGGIECDSSSPVIDGCIITGNTARDGGGIDCTFDAAPLIKDCVIYSNMATTDVGGGINVYACINAAPSIFNCLIYSNYAVNHGGAIYIFDSFNISISNCTIVNNMTSINSDGVYANGTSGAISLTNSILWNNGEFDVFGDVVSASFNTIKTADLNDLNNEPNDPMFVSGPLGEFYLSQELAFQLSDSEALGAGDDLAGNLFDSSYTTATNGIPDIDQVDRGYHYPYVAPVYYNLTTGVDGENGTINPSYPTPGQSYPGFARISLYASPEVNYKLLAWTGTDDDSRIYNSNTVTITEDKTVTVSFVPKVEYTLTVLVGEGIGTVTPETGVYYEGTYTLTAVADVGWQVHDWTGVDFVNSSNPNIAYVQLGSDRTVTVDFISSSQRLNARVVGGNGIITPKRFNAVLNEIVELTAEPDFRYKVSRWTGTDDDTSILATNSVTMSSMKEVTVEFEPARMFWLEAVVFDDGTGENGQLVTTRGNGGVLEKYESGKIVDGEYIPGGYVPSGAGFCYEYENVVLTAIPDNGYAIAGWYDMNVGAIDEPIYVLGPNGFPVLDPDTLEKVVFTDSNYPLQIDPTGTIVYVKFVKTGMPIGTIAKESDGSVYTTIQSAINSVTGSEEFADYLLGMGLNPNTSTIDEYTAAYEQVIETIVIADGVYEGWGNTELDFYGWPITLQSENGPENCIIDCNELGRAVIFNSGEEFYTVLDGFTITNGTGYEGGAILFSGRCQPRIINCIIINSSAASGGGGIAIVDNIPDDFVIAEYDPEDPESPVIWPFITKCTISGNSATGDGGGIMFRNSTGLVTNTIIGDAWILGDEGNSADGNGGGVFCGEGSMPVFLNCLVSGNSAASGGGFYLDDGSPAIIRQTTIAYNLGGGIIANESDPFDTADINVSHCIIWGNGDDLDGYEAEYSCIENGADGDTNIKDDPYFVSGYRSGFYLNAGEYTEDEFGSLDYIVSRCINAGQANFFTDLVNDYNIGKYLVTNRTGELDVDAADLGFHNEIYTGHILRTISLSVGDWTNDGLGYGQMEYRLYDDYDYKSPVGILGLEDSPEVFNILFKYSIGDSWDDDYVAGYNDNLRLDAIPDYGFRVLNWTGTDIEDDYFASYKYYDDTVGDITALVDFEIIHARTIHVPGNYPYVSLQAAIKSARTGDTIVIAPGTYKATAFKIEGCGITITSENPNDPDVVASTIIDGEGQSDNSAFTIYGSGYSDVVTINGLTILNTNDEGARPMPGSNRPAGDDGRGSDDTFMAGSGGAFNISGDHIIANCVIRNSMAYGRPGAPGTNGNVVVGDEYPASENVPTGGDSGDAGGGLGGAIYVEYGSPQILNCIIEGCSAVGANAVNAANGHNHDDAAGISGGGNAGHGGYAMGGGIFINLYPGENPIIRNCTITDCIAEGGNGGVGGAGGKQSDGGYGGLPGEAEGAGLYVAVSDFFGFYEDADYGKVTVENCTFINNVARGGIGGDGGLRADSATPGYGGGTYYNIYLDDSQRDMRNCTARGGAVFCGEGIEGTFTDCEFTGNVTEGSISGQGGSNGEGAFMQEPRQNYQLPSYGGGVFFSKNSTAIFDDCKFYDNRTTYDELYTSEDNPLAAYFGEEQHIGYGGALCADGSLHAEINNSHISGNESSVGGGVYVCQAGEFLVNDCNVVGNTAALGGGMFVAESYLADVNSVTISGNIANPQSPSRVGFGGGLYLFTSKAIVRDSVVTNNSSTGLGGGVYLAGHEETIVLPQSVTILGVIQELYNNIIADNIAGNGGGGIANNWYVKSFIESCTITGNKVVNSQGQGYGGGIYSLNDTDTTVTNSIVWDNKADSGSQIAVVDGTIAVPYPSFLDLSYSDVQGYSDPNAGSIFIGIESILNVDDASIIDSDPLFTDGYYLSQVASYQDANSPCVDMGSYVLASIDPDNPNPIDAGLAAYTTRVDAGLDIGIVDLGYHYVAYEPELLSIIIDVIGDEFGTVSVAGDYVSFDPETNTYECLERSFLTVTATPVSDDYRVKNWTNVVDAPLWRFEEALVLVEKSKIVTVEFEAAVVKRHLVPSQYSTLQAAIDAASPNDEVIVAPGVHIVYNVNGLNFGGKPVVMSSEDPDDPEVVASTIVDCQGSPASPKRAFHFFSGEDPNTVVTGLTIKGGYAISGLGASSFGYIFDDEGNIIGGGNGMTSPALINAFGDYYYGDPMDIIVPYYYNFPYDSYDYNYYSYFGYYSYYGYYGYHDYTRELESMFYDSETGLYYDMANDRYINSDNYMVVDGITGLYLDPFGGVNPDSYGGAILCENSSSPTISHCVITECVVGGSHGGQGNSGSIGYDGGLGVGFGYGGAIACLDNSSPVVKNCIIKDNIAMGGEGGDGGDVYISDDNSDVILFGGRGGDAFGVGFGGAVYCEDGSSPIFEACEFINNMARSGKGGLGGGYTGTGGYFYALSGVAHNPDATAGGAIWIDSSDSKLTIKDCKFIENRACEVEHSNYFGASWSETVEIYTKGGAIYSDPNTTLSLEGCEFTSNYGGAMYFGDGCDITLKDCAFNNNMGFDEDDSRKNADIFQIPEFGITYHLFNQDDGLYFYNYDDSYYYRNYYSFYDYFNYNYSYYLFGLETVTPDRTPAGAIQIGAFGGLRLENCSFNGNVSSFDGGAVRSYSDTDAISCLFTGNKSAGDGGAISVIRIDDSNYANLEVNFDHCTFAENSAKGMSKFAEIPVGGGAVLLRYHNSTFTDCYFTDNNSTLGGGLALVEGKSIMYNGLLSGNTAIARDGRGGALMCDNTDIEIVNCLIKDNKAPGQEGSGGALSFYGGNASIKRSLTNCLLTGNYAGAQGGAISCQIGSNPLISNSTFSDNGAGQFGGAIACDWWSNVSITDSIFTNNSNLAISMEDTFEGSIEFSQFYSNVDGDMGTYEDGAGLTSSVTASAYGMSNIEGDPNFVTGLLGDFYLQQDASVAIDTGSGSANAAAIDLSGYTTDPNHLVTDSGLVDRGYHYKTLDFADPNSAFTFNVSVVTDSSGKAHGRYSVEPAPFIEPDIYIAGTVITVTAIPDASYRVAKWDGGTIDDGSTDVVNTVIVSRDYDITIDYDQPEEHVVGSMTDITTIQRTINEAKDGDIIRLQSGRYAPVYPHNKLYIINKTLTFSGTYSDSTQGAIDTVLFNFHLNVLNCDLKFEGVTMESGAMRIHSSIGTMNNCRFVDCGYGALRLYQSPVKITDTSFINCGITARDGEDGTHIWFWVDDPGPGNTIRSHDGDDGHHALGGAIGIYSSSPVIENCNFEGCYVLGGNGGRGEDGDPGPHSTDTSPPLPPHQGGEGGWAGRGYGGAVFCTTESHPVFNNCSFTDCSATGGNGGDGGPGFLGWPGGRGGNWQWADNLEVDDQQRDIEEDGWGFGYTFDELFGPYSAYGDTGYFYAGWWQASKSDYYDPASYWSQGQWDDYNFQLSEFNWPDLGSPFDHAWYKDHYQNYGTTGIYDAPWKYSGYGGAFYCQTDSSATFEECTFSDNKSFGGFSGIGGDGATITPRTDRRIKMESMGGAVYSAPGCNVEFTLCDFTGNDSDVTAPVDNDDPYVSFGGAVAVEENASVKFDECTLTDNQACLGGGLYWNKSDVSIIDSTIDYNTAYHGAGLYSVDSKAMIFKTKVNKNIAKFGLAIAVDPDADYAKFGQGGGYCSLSTLSEITASSFTQNEASASGGALYLGGTDGILTAQPILTNNLFEGNIAGRDGGAISSNWYAEPMVVNCNLLDNNVTGLATVEGIGHGGAVSANYNSFVTVMNSIVMGNTVGVDADVVEQFYLGDESYGAALTVIDNNISDEPNSVFVKGFELDPYAPTMPTNANLTWANNFSADPIFVEGLFGLYYLSQISAGQDINSPCIDAGNPDVPFELSVYTTNTQLIPDQAPVDVGMHYLTSDKEYTLTIEVVGFDGDINPGAGERIYPFGSIVTLEALPDEGFRVMEWTGTDNDLEWRSVNSVVMDQDRIVTIEFESDVLRKIHVPTDFTSIEEAIIDAGSNDEIIVDPGTYFITNPDGIDFLGKNISLVSSAPDDPNLVNATIIDCRNLGRAFHFQSGEDRDTVVMGFAIVNGFIEGDEEDLDGMTYGGSILCENGSSPTIRHCVFRNCSVVGRRGEDGFRGTNAPVESDENGQPGTSGTDGFGNGCGGAIACIEESNPLIGDCVFENNVVRGGAGGAGGNGGNGDGTGLGGVGGDGGNAGGLGLGGAIYAGNISNPIILNCQFNGNNATQGYAGDGGIGGVGSEETRVASGQDGDMLVEGLSAGGAVYFGLDSDPNILECEFNNNQAFSIYYVTYVIPPADDAPDGTPPTTHRVAYKRFTIGGSLYVESDNTAKITSSEFVDSRGGGLFFENSVNVDIDACLFEGNRDPNNGGGAIYVGSGGIVDVNDSTFILNATGLENGGAISLASNAIITNCNFVGNSSTGDGGAIDVFGEEGLSLQINNTHFGENKGLWGGAIFASIVDVEIADSNFVDNTAKSGGGLYVEIGSLKIDNSDVSGNIASDVFAIGGGIASVNSHLDMSDTTVQNNVASGGNALGGGIAVDEGYGLDVSIDNCLITDNKAGKRGGGLSLNWFIDATVTNSTIAENTVSGLNARGGGIAAAYASVASFKDTVVWGNDGMEGTQISVTGGSDGYLYPSTVSFDFSDLQTVRKVKKTSLTLIAETPEIQEDNDVTQATLVDEDAILSKFEAGDQTVKVIVTLKNSETMQSFKQWDSLVAVQALRNETAARQDMVLSTMAADEFAIRQQFVNIPGFSGEVNIEGLYKLMTNPDVKFIEPVRYVTKQMAQAIPLANAMTPRETYNGTGIAIAIVDDGIDYTHPMLGGGTFPNNKVIGGYDLADDDPDPMPRQTAFSAHGTACAGIAAGSLGQVGDYIGGVAHNARLYALKIEDENGGLSSDASLAAWDWCVTHQYDDPDNPLMVISNSWGIGWPFANAAEADAFSPAMAASAVRVDAAGISNFASSGNDGFAGQGISWPAAMSKVISVGAVYDYNDQVTEYSNTADNLDILAPADPIYTTDIVGALGYTDGDYMPYFNGTSSACPFAAGVAVGLQAASRDLTGGFLTPDDVRRILVDSGDPVTDTKVAITKPRVNLGNAIASLGLGGPPIFVEEGSTLIGFEPDDTDSNERQWNPINDNISADPNFVGNYFLSHTEAGQLFDSPCIDMASADGIAFTNDPNYTTRTDSVEDLNEVDMGYHNDPIELSEFFLQTELIYDANYIVEPPVLTVESNENGGFFTEFHQVRLSVTKPPVGFNVRWTDTDYDDNLGHINMVTMDEDKFVTAEIFKDSYRLTIRTVGEGKFYTQIDVDGVKLTDENNPSQERRFGEVYQDYDYGTKVYLYAEPDVLGDPKFRVARWYGTDSEPDWYDENDPEKNKINAVTVTGDMTILIEFEPDVIASNTPRVIEVPGHFSNLDKALEFVREGDVIQISPGYYESEGIIFDKDFKITATNPGESINAEDTVINFSTAVGTLTYGVLFTSDTTNAAILSGVTITGLTRTGFSGENGDDDYPDGFDGLSVKGAGMFISEGASPIIRNCIISNFHLKGGNGGNGANAREEAAPEGSPEGTPAQFIPGGYGGWGGYARGAGVYVSTDAAPIFENCTIEDCSAIGGNGGDGGNALDRRGAGHGGLWSSEYISWIRLGYLGDYKFYSGYGGGVYCDAASSPVFTNCTISDNETRGGVSGVGGNTGAGLLMPDTAYEIPSFGGGIYCAANSSVVFTECEISNNSAAKDALDFALSPYLGYGGGIAFGGDGTYMDQTEITLDRCVVEYNDASTGGGLYCIGAEANFDNCLISHNTAYKGAGMFAIDGKVNVTKCDIMENKAGIFTDLPPQEEYIDPDADNSTDPATDEEQVIVDLGIAEGQGGGMYYSSTDVKLRDSYIFRNEATGAGGGVYVSGIGAEPSSIVNCLLDHNKAGHDGAAISVNWYARTQVENCTIYNNIVTSDGFEELDVVSGKLIDTGFGGGIFVAYDSTVDIFRSILTSNGAVNGSEIFISRGDPEAGPSSFTMNYCAVYDAMVTVEADFQDETEYVEFEMSRSEATTVGLGANNLPKFVDAGFNFAGKDRYDNFYLNQSSSLNPLIDAGGIFAVQADLDLYTTDPLKTLDTGYVDIGFHYPHILALAKESCGLCDLVKDGLITFDDLAKFATRWLDSCNDDEDPDCEGSDFDSNQEVDIVDYVILASCWNASDTTPPSPNRSRWAVDGEPDFVEGDLSERSVTMTAEASVDAWYGMGIQYEFRWFIGDDPNTVLTSGWQDESTFTQGGFAAEETCTFAVRVRDPKGNMTMPSVEVALTTGEDKESPHVIGIDGSELLQADWAWYPLTDIETGIVGKVYTGLPYSSSPTNADYATITMSAQIGYDNISTKKVYYQFLRIDPVTSEILLQSDFLLVSEWVDGEDPANRLVLGQEYGYQVVMYDGEGDTFNPSLPSLMVRVIANIPLEDGDVTPPPIPVWLGNIVRYSCTQANVDRGECLAVGIWDYMEVVPVVDPDGSNVEYLFEQLTGSSLTDSSGWITQPYWEAKADAQFTVHKYRVKARDTSQLQNESGYSIEIIKF